MYRSIYTSIAAPDRNVKSQSNQENHAVLFRSLEWWWMSGAIIPSRTFDLGWVIYDDLPRYTNYEPYSCESIINHILNDHHTKHNELSIVLRHYALWIHQNSPLWGSKFCSKTTSQNTGIYRVLWLEGAQKCYSRAKNRVTSTLAILRESGQSWDPNSTIDNSSPIRGRSVLGGSPQDSVSG